MVLNLAIRDYIETHGIKQSFLAEKCGWSRVRVNCIIKGKQRISAEDMRQICDALSLSYDYFYRAKK